MIDDNLAAQGAVSSGLLGSPYGGNPQGMSPADYQRMQAAQLTAASSNIYPGAVIGPSSLQGAWNAAVTAGTPFHKSKRLSIEVDKVTNGFVLAVGSERLIAKDLEELQGLFIAQVASMLLEDK